jgi:hypothetical protein
MTKDLSDPAAALADVKDRLRIMQNVPQSDGDSQHPGAGYESVQIGVNAQAAPITDTDADEAVAIGSSATADGFGTVSIGGRAYAQYETSTAVGWSADAWGPESTAVGVNTWARYHHSTAIGYDAQTTKPNQVRLGTSAEEVSVPGRLNVARRTPSSSADTQGSTGDITSDDNYIYVKTTAGWKRAALSTF